MLKLLDNPEKQAKLKRDILNRTGKNIESFLAVKPILLRLEATDCNFLQVNLVRIHTNAPDGIFWEGRQDKFELVLPTR